MTKKLLELEGISKSYPGVIANSDVSFDINVGEVHALLGENGAGKSTLVKTIYGLVKPDNGRMSLNGKHYVPGSPSEARKAGIAMVFQHFSLFEALSVAENISLGMESPPNQRDLAKKIKSVSNSYGLPLEPGKTVGSLSAGERQRVEIVRCLLQEPKLLIMDEPTSVLTPQEVQILFETLRKIKSEGRSILYISHKLEEIRKLCDTATILRLGKKVETCTPSKTSSNELAEMMVGSSIQIPQQKKREIGNILLSLENIVSKSINTFGTSLSNLTLDLHAGEIFGVGGVAGNGQDELLSILSGELIAESGQIKLEDRIITADKPRTRRELCVLSAPEERLGHSAAPNMSLVENTLMTASQSQHLVSKGFIDWEKTRAFTEKIIEEFDVRTPSIENVARSLSGGNLQKFVIGREIQQEPKVFVVNQPTWGVDAAAAASIRQAILTLADNGAAILIISQDLDELLEISDRFAALNEGKLSDALPTRDLTVDQIGLMMGGKRNLELSDAKF
ncbi:MAG: ABC transporter [Marinovum sp.]|nr:ABC transporter [Marinovum sp.]PDH59876.1 MAG: ABC transporter [Rhodobacteraceae bacterium MED-G07]